MPHSFRTHFRPLYRVQELFRVYRSACLVAAAIALAVIPLACGGDNPPGGGSSAGTPTVVTGPITGFGSIFVSDLELELDEDTELSIEGQPGTEDDLALGMIVTVEAEVSGDGTGVAQSVSYDDEIEGTVDSIDVAGGTITILGQVVHVDDLTVFDGVTLEAMAEQNVLEISGFPSSDGSIRATRVELKSETFEPGEDELELKGTITDPDPDASTFRIGTLVIFHGDASLENLPAGGLEDGLFVEVKSTQGMVDGRLIASSVEVENEDDDLDEGLEIELEGLINQFTSASQFEVGGRPVSTDDQTTFENGTAEDLGVDVKVEVEGVIDSDGVLAARQVSLRRSTGVRIEADVESVVAASGIVTLLGLEVSVNDSTQMEDDSAADVSPLTLEDLEEGDRLEIRGFSDAERGVVVTLLQRDDPDDEVRLRATIDSINGENLVVLGVEAITDAGTRYENILDQPISADDFFAVAREGTLVQIQGFYEGGAILAEEIDLEN